LQCGVPWLDGERELGIGAGIFMPAIELRLRRQGHQLLQRVPHHLGVAFEELAAADREQRVADKHDAAFGKEITDMPARVTWRFDDECVRVADPDAIALAHLDVDGRNAARFHFRADDDTTGQRLQPLVAGGVVAVVMGDEDMGERPALLLECRENRIRVRSVDRGRGPCFGVMNQHAIIVAARGKLVNFKLCHLRTAAFRHFSAHPSIPRATR
jgi:hypothetical protein